jgi:hypothetical protein
MSVHEIMQAAKLLANDLNAAKGFIGSVTTFLIVAKSMIRMFGREKSFAF